MLLISHIKKKYYKGHPIKTEIYSQIITIVCREIKHLDYIHVTVNMWNI